MNNKNIAVVVLGGLLVVGLGYYLFNKPEKKDSNVASVPNIAGGNPRTNPYT